MKTLEQIKSIIEANQQSGLETYAGLTSAEIGYYNRTMMFGGNIAEDWDEDVWSMWTD